MKIKLKLLVLCFYNIAYYIIFYKYVVFWFFDKALPLHSPSLAMPMGAMTHNLNISCLVVLMRLLIRSHKSMNFN